MFRYALGRVLGLIPVLFGISLLVFLVMRLIPGDPALMILGERCYATAACHDPGAAGAR